jgi:hypothetical protein
VVIIEPSRISEVRQRFDIPESWAGFYHEGEHYAAVLDDRKTDKFSLSDQIALRSRVVHELTHSGTKNLDRPAFYTEALAGLGELEYLDWLHSQGKHEPATDFTLQKYGVALHVPADARYLHASEADGLPTEGAEHYFTSQGLVAISSLRAILATNGYSNRDLLESASSPVALYARIMRDSLDAAHVGLSEVIGRHEDRIEGVVQATATLQQAVPQAVPGA